MRTVNTGANRDATRLRRIERHERRFDEAQELLRSSARSAKENKRLRFLLRELSAYYESAAWREDFEADEAGLLPKELKRGVLSEDGIYDLLEEAQSEALTPPPDA